MTLHQPHHHHDHNHVPAERKALWTILILNGLFMVVEVVVGLLTGSLTVLSDAAHMMGDVAAISVGLIASMLAARPADLRRSFGWSGAQVLGATINAIGLFVVAGWIIFEAYGRLTSTVPALLPMPILIVGVLGLFVNLGSVWYLSRSGSDNLNIRAMLAHMMADALGSIGAIVAALMITQGWYVVDPIISAVIALLVFWSGWSVFKNSVKVLLGFAPSGINPEKVVKALKSLPTIRDVHDLHVWSIDGKYPFLTVHVVTDCNMQLKFGYEQIMKQIHKVLLDKFGVEHVTVQLEYIDDPECKVNCDGLEEDH